MWPPPITIKKHARAKHVKLKASALNGLELVVPRRFNQKEVPFILEQNRVWIEKQLLIIQAESAISDALPHELLFSAINQTWKIEYISYDKKPKLIRRPHQNTLVITGHIEEKLTCKKLLLLWIKKQAKIYLLKKLTEVSNEINLTFESLSIRNQKCRWGSCSSKKAINLNYKLIFLPEKLVRYVLIHELCHTIHLNHSEKFWKLVEKFDPEWKSHKRQLHEAGKSIPRLCL